MLSFRPNQKITTRELLFGRNQSHQQLNRILNNIYRGTNCQIQGERRFGKTSILNCVHSTLTQNTDRIFIPIFLDFKSKSTIKGTGNVYRHIVSCLIQTLTKSKFLSETINLRSKKIVPNVIAEDIFDSLVYIDDFRIEGIFEDLILKFAEEFNINFVLLIDEYEHLLAKSLTDPFGFMLIRNLSDEYFKNCTPLTYVISGSKEWNLLCSKLGSPELNNQGAGIIYIGSIVKCDFDDMFNYYLKDASLEESELLNKDKIFLQSGGIPYYAKKIAETLISDGEISSNILNNEFISIWDNLEQEEIILIEKISNGLKINNGNIIKNLVDRGILRLENAFANINGELFREYFLQKISTSENKPDNIADQLFNYAQSIFEFVEKINKNYKNQQMGDYLFEPTISEESHRKIISQICSNKEKFSEFINIIYIIFFEKTAFRRHKKDRIPNSLKTDFFLNRLDSLRQEFHHSTDSKEYKIQNAQFRRGELFKHYLGKEVEPLESQFLDIQIKVLLEAITFLKKVHNVYN